MYIYIYIYIHLYTCVYICVCVYASRPHAELPPKFAELYTKLRTSGVEGLPLQYRPSHLSPPPVSSRCVLPSGILPLSPLRYPSPVPPRYHLAFTRYCHYQYCAVDIVIKGGRREIINLECAIMWVMKGGVGCPNKKRYVHRIVLIRAQKGASE